MLPRPAPLPDFPLHYRNMMTGVEDDGRRGELAEMRMSLRSCAVRLRPTSYWGPPSGLMPAAFMIGSSLPSSLSRYAVISFGVVGQVVAPRSA